jgi:hypothetical protein
LEYASVVWNSITSTDANKLEGIQQKFTSVCFYSFFPCFAYNYTVSLEKIGLHSLRKKRYYLDAIFFVQVYRGLKSCTSLSENISLCVSPSNLRELHLEPFLLITFALQIVHRIFYYYYHFLSYNSDLHYCYIIIIANVIELLLS